MQVQSIRLPPTPDGPATLRTEIAPSNLHAIRTWVDIAKDSRAELRPEISAIEAWVTFGLGLFERRPEELKRAGTLIETTPEFKWPGKNLDKPWRWESAAVAYQDAGAFDQALLCAQTWSRQTPEDPRSHRKVAELCWRLGKVDDALRALEKVMADDGPSDRHWENTALMEIAFENAALQVSLQKVASGDHIAEAIETAAGRIAWKVSGENLAAWCLPWFDKLSEKARERFWFGLFAVSSPDVLANTGQAMWDNAADNFSEALAFELKHLVIEPFAKESSNLVDRRDENWVRLIEGKASLGQVIGCLLSSLRPTYNAARALHRRLDSRHRSFLREMFALENSLKLLTQRRNDAQHGTLPEGDVRQLFADVCRLLKALHTP
jgi:tetratricopeptide (TPR) repeat protein